MQELHLVLIQTPGYLGYPSRISASKPQKELGRSTIIIRLTTVLTERTTHAYVVYSSQNRTDSPSAHRAHRQDNPSQCRFSMASKQRNQQIRKQKRVINEKSKDTIEIEIAFQIQLYSRPRLPETIEAHTPSSNRVQPLLRECMGWECAYESRVPDN